MSVCDVLGGDVRGELRILRDQLAAVAPGDRLEHGERRDDERLVRGDELGEVRVRRAVDEQVHETIRADVDRVARAGEVADVHDRHALPRVRRIHHGFHGGLVERRRT